ncbi:MAG: SRPBCC family protein [Phycisphaerales bacterium]
MPNSVTLHRVLKCAPERLFRAFSDPRALVKWMPPHGFTAEVHSMDFRVGGAYRMSFSNLGTGQSHSFGGTYLEIKPGELIRHTDTFDDPNLPGQMSVTVTFRKVMCGTELRIVQENIPAVIPAEMCYLGWQESLSLLTLLVEPEIP